MASAQLPAHKHIIKKFIFFIPQTMFVQRFGNQYKMFKKFSGSIFKRIIIHGNFQCHIHHVQAYVPIQLVPSACSSCISPGK